MSDITITRGETTTIGHFEVRQVTGTWITLNDEPFVEIDGAIYAMCPRCGHDAGHLTEYGFILGGICFKCNGFGHGRKIGTPEDTAKVVKRRQADRARAARKRQAEADEKATALAAWRTANPEAAAKIDAVIAERPDFNPYVDDGTDEQWVALNAWSDKWGGFITDIVSKAQHRPLSDKQTAAVVKAIDETIARLDARQAAKDERLAAARYLGAKGEKVTVTGIVDVASGYETHYGYTTQWNRLLVVRGTGEHEGVTIKASGSGATLFDANKGDTVEITGTVKDHSEYEDVPQTVVTRAKVRVLAEAE